MTSAATPEPGIPQGTLLAFDFGLRRIGIAVGQTHTCTANPLKTIVNTGAQALGEIMALVREWRPSALIVGLPLDADAEETDMSKAARAFGASLAESCALPVHFQDERLTSRVAETLFAEQRARGERRRRDASLKDAMAAQIILENWLQSHPGRRPKAGPEESENG